MIAHLSSEQFSECVLGQPSLTVARHVQDCPACQTELANFRDALGEFRGAVRAWSQEEAQAVLVSAPEPRSQSRQWMWAVMVAAVCIIASFFPWHNDDGAATNDALLLKQVDAQLSRTAPSPMEPLMKLVVEQQ